MGPPESGAEKPEDGRPEDRDHDGGVSGTTEPARLAAYRAPFRLRDVALVRPRAPPRPARTARHLVRKAQHPVAEQHRHDQERWEQACPNPVVHNGTRPRPSGQRRCA